MTLVLELTDSLAEQLVDSASAQGETPDAFVIAALAERLLQKPDSWRPVTDEERVAAREELKHLRPHDPEAVFRKFGLPWPPTRSLEELAADAEAALAAMSPEVKERLTRQGLI